MRGHPTLVDQRDPGVDAERRFPRYDVLAAALAHALGEDLLDGFTIIDRRAASTSSTYATSVTTCRKAGHETAIFCKYSIDAPHDSHGHRGGVQYEADVYQHVLEPLALPGVPRFYGAHREPERAEIWLLTEYLPETTTLSSLYKPSSLVGAAGWIGAFHAHSGIGRGVNEAGLKSLDSAYYNDWALRTVEFAGDLNLRYPWLADLCQAYQEILSALLDESVTITHGEFYGKNILVRRGEIFVVDWESAAIAAGEIDLAALTERWPEEWITRAERAYADSRWPSGRPANFERRLDVARLYLTLRWLGDRPEWTLHRSSEWRFERLRSIGERLGLI